MYADLDAMRGMELAVGFSECEPSVGRGLGFRAFAIVDFGLGSTV